MREQLIRYVDLLFAGAENAQEVKQEILQNTLDRYDDLIRQGKTPEAAYRLAISGIGDVNEILSGGIEEPVHTAEPKESSESLQKKRMLHAISTACWILTPIPLFLIGDEVGLCLTLVLISLATALNIYAKKMYDNVAAPKTATAQAVNATNNAESAKAQQDYSAKKELRRGINTIVSILSIAAYIALGCVLDMWIPTLLVFPLFGAIKGIIYALIDLKEAHNDEN